MMTAMEQTGATFAQLARQRMTPAQVASYIETVLPADQPDGQVSDTLKARRQTIAHLTWSGMGAEMAGSDQHGSTLWAAYNAITEYVDHVRPAEAKSASAKRTANESALFGANAALKVLALQVARRQLVAA